MTVPAAVVVPGPPAPSPEPGLSPEAVVEGVLGHAMHVMALELKPHPTRPKDSWLPDSPASMSLPNNSASSRLPRHSASRSTVRAGGLTIEMPPYPLAMTKLRARNGRRGRRKGGELHVVLGHSLGQVAALEMGRTLGVMVRDQA